MYLLHNDCLTLYYIKLQPGLQFDLLCYLCTNSGFKCACTTQTFCASSLLLCVSEITVIDPQLAAGHSLRLMAFFEKTFGQ